MQAKAALARPFQSMNGPDTAAVGSMVESMAAAAQHAQHSGYPTSPLRYTIYSHDLHLCGITLPYQTCLIAVS